MWVVKRVGRAVPARRSAREIGCPFFISRPMGLYDERRVKCPSTAGTALPTLFCIIAVAFLFPLFASASIELTLSRVQCQPGDVVELHAESSFDELTIYELKLPQHDALHLVAHQRQPIEYADGVYSQKDVWVLQPVRSGEIELSGIKAFVKKGDVIEELELPNQSIEVLAYVARNDDFTPEPLPGFKIEGSGSKLWIFFLVVGVFVVGFLLCFRKRPVVELVQDTEPTLADLNAALSTGEMPIDLIEQLLADESLSVSAKLRSAMERAVYRNDASDLKDVLGKEAAK